MASGMRRLGAEITETLSRCAAVLPPAAAIGAATALFLHGLERITAMRESTPHLLWALPLCGLLSVALYRLCDRSGRGNNLILDEIHAPGGGVPARMAPLVLLATWITHLGGGSAGREGTAVQIGGGVAGGWAGLLRLNADRTRLMLFAGVAAGFGAVFGTPLAGAIFALEVICAGALAYEFALPCLTAAYAGDLVAKHFGVEHKRITVALPDALGHADLLPPLLLKSLAAGVVFGLGAALFARFSHLAADLFKKHLPNPWLRVVAGAALIIALTLALGTRAYQGLGVTPVPGEPDAPHLAAAFATGGIVAYAWLLKIIFTGITLGCGFRGGEVTPLFVTGALLGHVVAAPLGLPHDLGAALGFVAVFAGAANTPIAGTLLGVELFGGALAPLFAIACFAAYRCSGARGIYSAQRLAIGKHRV